MKTATILNCTPNVRQNIRGVFMSKYSFEEKCEAVQRVRGKMNLPSHGKEFLHPTVSTFLHASVSSF